MQDNNIMRDWLSRRKISDSIISEFGIHWGSNPNVGGGCIVIPIHGPDGEFLYNKYRRNPLSEDTPKYVYDKGGKIALYAVDKIDAGGPVLITEGEMDALVAWSSNIPAVSSTGGAMSFQEEWAKMLECNDVTFCFDNDAVGGAGMVKALGIIPKARVLFLPDRPGVKDISDYVAAGGDLKELLSTARAFDGLESVVSDRAERLALWKSVHFHDAYIKEHTKPTYAPRSEADRTGVAEGVARAKAYPITSLLEFNTRGKAICPFHNEKTGSLHYYKDQNRAYCFGGCGRGYDSIDVYRKLYGVGFKEAVEKLQ